MQAYSVRRPSDHLRVLYRLETVEWRATAADGRPAVCYGGSQARVSGRQDAAGKATLERLPPTLDGQVRRQWAPLRAGRQESHFGNWNVRPLLMGILGKLQTQVTAPPDWWWEAERMSEVAADGRHPQSTENKHFRRERRG